MNIIFKLSTGEIIIGNVTTQSSTDFELSYPALLTQNGIEPFMPFGMGKVTLYISNIVGTTKPSQQIEDAYNSMFGPKSTSDLGCTKQ